MDYIYTVEMPDGSRVATPDVEALKSLIGGASLAARNVLDTETISDGTWKILTDVIAQETGIQIRRDPTPALAA